MKPLPLILASSSPRRLTLLQQIGIVPDQVVIPDIDETPARDEQPRPYAVRMARAKAAAVRSSTHLVLTADTVVAVGRRILPKADNAEQVRACLTLLSGRRHRVMTALVLTGPESRPLGQHQADRNSLADKVASRNHDLEHHDFPIQPENALNTGTPQGCSPNCGIQDRGIQPSRNLDSHTSEAGPPGGSVPRWRSTERLVESVVTFNRLTTDQIERYVATGEGEGKAGGYAINGHAASFIRFLSGSHSGVVGLPLFETAQLLRGFGWQVP